VLCVSTFGPYIITGGKDRRLYFWDTSKETEAEFVLVGHTSSGIVASSYRHVLTSTVISTKIYSTSNLIVTGSGDCRVRLWYYH
jgi:WD40 repeat protein